MMSDEAAGPRPVRETIRFNSVSGILDMWGIAGPRQVGKCRVGQDLDLRGKVFLDLIELSLFPRPLHNYNTSKENK